MESNTTIPRAGLHAPSVGTVRGLPPPDAAALVHSARVTTAIRDAIHAAGGWIPFRDFMRIALYAPGLGYYAAGAQKIGTFPQDASDFVTAPEISPLFGYALANQFAEVLEISGGEVLELGAGSGKLAANLLARLDALQIKCRYSILEPSAELRERQRATIGHLAPRHLSKVGWLDALPATWTGVIFGNEVLDALPVEWLMTKDGRRFRRGVTSNDSGELRLVERELTEALPGGKAAAEAKHECAMRDALRERFPAGDYLSELNPEGEALSATLASLLAAGMLLWIDYGFPAREYYHPQRVEGTLMCHYRHRAHADPLLWPGLQDITAHVDFSALARATCDAGAELAGYSGQASFLIDCGIADLLLRSGTPGSSEFVRASAAVQRLLSPAEMGELFKVIAFTRRIDVPLRGFTTGDRSHRL